MASGACPRNINITPVIDMLNSQGETEVALKINHGMTLRKRPTAQPERYEPTDEPSAKKQRGGKKHKYRGGAPGAVLNGLASIFAASTLVAGAAGAWCYVGPSVHAFLIGWFHTGLQPQCTTATTTFMGFNTGINFDRALSTAYSLISKNDRCESIDRQYNFANDLVNIKLTEIIAIVGLAGISSYSTMKNIWLIILNTCINAMSSVVSPKSAAGERAAKTQFDNKVVSELGNPAVLTQDPVIVTLLTQVAAKLEKIKASDATPEPEDLIPNSAPATEYSTRESSPSPSTSTSTYGMGGRKYKMTKTQRKSNKRSKNKRSTNKRSKNNKRSKSKRSKSKRSKSIKRSKNKRSKK